MITEFFQNIKHPHKRDVDYAKVSEAFALAAALHFDQSRKVGPREDQSLATDYMTHLAEVMALAIQGHGDTNQLIAAVLHDAIEDQPDGLDDVATRVLIREKFGQKALDYVEACTDGEPDAKGQKASWRQRKIDHIAHIRHLAQNGDAKFLLVTVCDKISNASAIVNDVKHHGDIVWSRFQGKTPAETSWYYISMLQVIKENRSKLKGAEELIARLERLVAELVSLAAVAQIDQFTWLQDDTDSLIKQIEESERDNPLLHGCFRLVAPDERTRPKP